MELQLSKKQYWKRKRYDRLDAEGRNCRRRSRVVRLGIRIRRLRPIMKLKLVSPLRIWKRFKDAYLNMMLRLAGSVGNLNSGNGFGVIRIPRAREAKLEYTKEEFEKRIVYEIYKSLVSSSHLGSAYA